ncbi:hypothetical protein [Maritalea porphyrae]|uniref:Uncharacterized protein n=1 Tax=Maritalea porphyrae TaxID=880732 RepID=A0ABQ5US55_9HYPH|nr:hypothetical protein [Maritalea porphyrae]GLQ18105.1 hypothetical protein GCM10007879_23540 [Maritalea porphyrae]
MRGTPLSAILILWLGSAVAVSNFQLLNGRIFVYVTEMKILAIVFWIVVLAAIAWCGMHSIEMMIYASYHPMYARGDLLYPLRVSSIPLLILTSIVVASLWLWRRPLQHLIYALGMFVAASISLTIVLPRVESGYKQIYYVGEERFEIPWQFSPYSGSPDLGGKDFRIIATIPELIPEYDTREKTVTIGISIKEFPERAETNSGSTCSLADSYGRISCRWPYGKYFLDVSGDQRLFAEDKSGLYPAISALFDSFRVEAE